MSAAEDAVAGDLPPAAGTGPGAEPEPEPEAFALDRETIRLGDLLKVHYAMSGGEAKHVIQGGLVRVDGSLETRRGRRLRGGEVVWLEGEARPIRVVASPAG